MSDNKIDSVEEAVEKVEAAGLKFYQKWNQNHFTVFLILLAISVTGLILFNGFASHANIAAQVCAQINAVAMFFASFFGCCLLLCTIKVDVYDEIVNQHNVALAIFLLGVAYGVASCISKAAL